MSDGVVMTLLLAAGFATYFFYGNERFFGENALFESSQNLMLFCGVLAFFLAASRSLESACKSVLWALTLFCAAMLLREIDVRGTGLEPYLGPIFEQHIPYWVILVFGAALLLTVAMEMSKTWRRSMQWLFSLPGAWFATGILLYLVGDASEKNLFTNNDRLAQMTEESAELLGTLFIFCAGYVTLRRQMGLTNPQQTLSPDDAR